MATLRAEDFIDAGHPATSGLYRIAGSGLACHITPYGARLVSCEVLTADSHWVDVALGYPTLANYQQPPEDYMGAIVGRCANRIAGGRFSISGKDFQATQNEGTTTLHGGSLGLQGHYWTVREHTGSSLTLHYHSPDGEEGFPGNLNITVTYAIDDTATLRISYWAVTDQPTPVNLSNHAYWNLSGEGSPTIEDHLLQIRAAAYTPVDALLIPTGAIVPVAGQPFDFQQPTSIGSRINQDDPQLQYGKGYDHNWVLNGGNEPAVRLHSPLSGITLELNTTEPGLQFYSGNGLTGSRTGKGGRPYGYRSAVVLEPQHFPDAPHHPNFPTVLLQPGQLYNRTDTYRFTTA